MSIVKVNRSGATHKIYETTAATKQIGTLYNNEMFTWIEQWPGSSASGYYMQKIAFRGSDGAIKNGCIAAAQTDSVLSANICSLASFTKVINGKTYYGFKMRRDEELYGRLGNKLAGKAYKGRNILCESSTGGQSNSGLLSVVYLETDVNSGKYNYIVSNSNAFVDLGYDEGSMFNLTEIIICIKPPVKGAHTLLAEMFRQEPQAAEVLMGFTDKTCFFRRKYPFINGERHLPFFREDSCFYRKVSPRHLPVLPSRISERASIFSAAGLAISEPSTMITA